MGRISTGIGLVSGINSKDIIDHLITSRAPRVPFLHPRLTPPNQQTPPSPIRLPRLTSIRIFGQSVQKPQPFAAATTSTSDENVLTGTAANGAAIGSYTFQV